jgi:Carboxypeptidase regulatory-like domain
VKFFTKSALYLGMAVPLLNARISKTCIAPGTNRHAASVRNDNMSDMRVIIGLAFVLLLGANGGGCSGDPNSIGVQDYGSVTGRVLDATNNRPVANALISVGALYTATTDSQGGFTLARIPIGSQDVTASAPGYERASVTARVRKGQTASVNYLRIAPIGATATIAPPPTPTPSPEPSETPYVPPSSSPSPPAP